MNDKQHIEVTPEQLVLQDYITNALTRSLTALGAGSYLTSPDGKRDYSDLFKYGDPKFSDFYGAYRRGLGGVIVDKVAEHCWRDAPKIMNGDTEILTEEMEILMRRGLFKFLERADKLNRIGKYSIMYIGVNDGEQDPETPIGDANDLEATYFRVYSDEGTKIAKRDTVRTSERYGMPEIYNCQVTSMGDKEVTTNTLSIKFHYTRAVHLAEGALDSPIEGRSALERPWNALQDVVKTGGGAAEAFFRIARVESFVNQWQDFMRVSNMDVKELNGKSATVDPEATFNVALEQISGITEIPIRVLTGRGGGQLAGSEDRAAFSQTILNRQQQFCTGVLLQALQVLSNAGLFDLPENVAIEWPPREALSETEAAEVADKKASAFEKVARGLSTPAGGQMDEKEAFKAVGIDIEGAGD
jgi:hypothetical protein